jgi:hypothetical protein
MLPVLTLDTKASPGRCARAENHEFGGKDYHITSLLNLPLYVAEEIPESPFFPTGTFALLAQSCCRSR